MVVFSLSKLDTWIEYDCDEYQLAKNMIDDSITKLLTGFIQVFNKGTPELDVILGYVSYATFLSFLNDELTSVNSDLMCFNEISVSKLNVTNLKPRGAIMIQVAFQLRLIDDKLVNFENLFNKISY